MAGWEEIERAEPAFAAQVRRCFAIRKHATLATLRRDGSPRISGTEVDFGADGLHLGMMGGSVKALDLGRDPRLALHCPTVDPPEQDPASWLGEAKIAGVAVEVPTPAPAEEGSQRFRVDVTEVVLTAVAPSGDRLLITSWHPDRGLEVRERR